MNANLYNTTWTEYVKAVESLQAIEAQHDYSLQGLMEWKAAHAKYETLYDLIHRMDEAIEEEAISVIEAPAIFTKELEPALR